MKRYDVGIGQYEAEFGEWVKYEDARAAIQAAVLAEREACIKACEEVWLELSNPAAYGASRCEDAIGARSKS